jgi:hypothetical protein
MPKSRRQTKSQDGVADQKSEAIGADQKSEAIGADQKSEAVGRYHQPSARECALLVLRLMQAREHEVKDREVSRARISQFTLRNLCGRSQITNELLLEVQEFLLAAGWCLFCAGPTHFALIKRKAVEGWARISSGRIKDELTAVSLGTYDFERLEPLLMPREPAAADTDE